MLSKTLACLTASFIIVSLAPASASPLIAGSALPGAETSPSAEPVHYYGYRGYGGYGRGYYGGYGGYGRGYYGGYGGGYYGRGYYGGYGGYGGYGRGYYGGYR